MHFCKIKGNSFYFFVSCGRDFTSVPQDKQVFCLLRAQDLSLLAGPLPLLSPNGWARWGPSHCSPLEGAPISSPLSCAVHAEARPGHFFTLGEQQRKRAIQMQAAIPDGGKGGNRKRRFWKEEHTMHAKQLLGKPARRRARCLFLPVQDVLSGGAMVFVEGGSAPGFQGNTLLTLWASVSSSVKQDEKNPRRRHTVAVVHSSCAEPFQGPGGYQTQGGRHRRKARLSVCGE